MNSFASAEAVGKQYPEYSDAIAAAATASFLSGADWAYLAGIIASVIGAILVYLLFPKKDAGVHLFTQYHDEDTRAVSKEGL